MVQTQHKAMQPNEIKTMLIPDVFTQELKHFSTKTGKPITVQEQTKIKHNNKQTKLF